MMDIGLNNSGIDPDLATGLDLFLSGVVDNLQMKRLPGLCQQGGDILLQDRLTGILPHLQSGKATKGT